MSVSVNSPPHSPDSVGHLIFFYANEKWHKNHKDPPLKIFYTLHSNKFLFIFHDNETVVW